MKLSGLQKSVLSLYRQCLRETKKKPAVSAIMTSHVIILLNVCRYLKRISGILQGRFDRGEFQILVHSYLIFRSQFQHNMEISTRDFGAIEYLLRKGRRQLELYSDPGIKNIGS